MDRRLLVGLGILVILGLGGAGVWLGVELLLSAEETDQAPDPAEPRLESVGLAIPDQLDEFDTIPLTWDEAEPATLRLVQNDRVIAEHELAANAVTNVTVGPGAGEFDVELWVDGTHLVTDSLTVEPFEPTLDVPGEAAEWSELPVSWDSDRDATFTLTAANGTILEQQPIEAGVPDSQTVELRDVAPTVTAAIEYQDIEVTATEIPVEQRLKEATTSIDVAGPEDRVFGVPANATVPVRATINNTGEVTIEYAFDVYVDGEHRETLHYEAPPGNHTAGSTTAPDEDPLRTALTLNETHEPSANITVRSDDERWSRTMPVLYDRSGDGLYSWWEVHGQQHGAIETQLEAEGCDLDGSAGPDASAICETVDDLGELVQFPDVDPDRLDLVVGITYDDGADQFSTSDLETVTEWFDEMPVENRDGSTGISLHVVAEQTNNVGSFDPESDDWDTFRDDHAAIDTAVGYSVVMTDIEGNVVGLARLGGRLSMVEPDLRTSPRRFVLTHELLHNVVGPIQAERHHDCLEDQDHYPTEHACDGFLSYNADETYLPEDIGAQIERNGFWQEPVTSDDLEPMTQPGVAPVAAPI